MLEFLHKTNKIALTKGTLFAIQPYFYFVELSEENEALYNEDIVDFCNDLKVIEKKSVRKLLKWREKMRVILGK